MCDAKDIRFTLDYDQRFTKIHIGLKSKKNLFLILKESINNAIKHSGCNNLLVRIKVRDDVAGLLVRDDGKGFETILTENNSYRFVDAGNGLNNIQSRAAELGATLEIDSAINKGTTIKIKFKVNTNV